MAFAEDLAPFFDVGTGFAVAATLQGVAVNVIADTSAVDEFGVVTQRPSVLMTRTAAASAAPGQSLVIASGGLPAQLAHLAATYTVRSVNPEPPDGVLVRLDLVRA